MRLLFLVIFPLVLGALGVRFTMRKLDKMEQLRAFKPAEAPRIVTVLEKRRTAKTCWIRWFDGAAITKAGAHRFSIPRENCDRHAPGDQMSVLFFPEDEAPYAIEDSVFASDGNLAFDRELLGIESVVMIVVPLVELFIFILRSRPGPHLTPS